MTPRFIYPLLSLLSLISVFAAIIFVVLGFVGLAQKFKGDLFGSAFLCFVLAVVLYALWDIGTRLCRVEERLRREKDPNGSEK